MGRGKVFYEKPLYEVKQISDLKDMLNQSCKMFKEHPAFLIKDKSEGEYRPVSYEQFKKDVDCLGTALINLGLKGKRIALIGENRYEWAVSYLAVVNGTGVIVPIDKELPENEIESLIHRSEAAAVIFSDKFEAWAKRIAQNNKKLKVLIDIDVEESNESCLSFSKLIQNGNNLIKDGDGSFLDAKIDNKGMSMMLFTSGTTEKSKAVMLSHKNICSNLMDMCSMTYIGEKDIFLSVLPIHHTYECTCGFLCQIYRGCTIAYCEGLRHILKNLQESKATMMISVPLILESIYKRIWEQAGKKRGMVLKMKAGLGVSNFLRLFGIDLRKIIFKQLHEMLGGKVRLLVNGAAGINPEVSKGFRNFGLPCIQGYGLTECSPIVALNRDVFYKDDAAGLPMPGMEVKIEDVSADGIGEIVVKGPNVMLGYYENEEATAEVLKDGWFYTGDLGYIDKDGFVHITGRKKDVIVTKNGKNIFPEELEKILNNNPYITESMIWGRTDEDGGTIICATIIPNKDFIREKFGENIDNEAVKKMISGEIREFNKKMPLYRHIREFQVRDEELIKTTTKKIKRYMELKK